MIYKLHGYGGEYCVGKLSKNELEVLSKISGRFEINSYISYIIYQMFNKDYFDFDDILHEYSISSNISLIDEDMYEYRIGPKNRNIKNRFDIDTLENGLYVSTISIGLSPKKSTIICPIPHIIPNNTVPITKVIFTIFINLRFILGQKY